MSLQKLKSFLSHHHKATSWGGQVSGVSTTSSSSPTPPLSVASSSASSSSLSGGVGHPNSLGEGRTPLESPSPQMHGGGNGGLYASSGGSGPPRPGSDGGASSGAHSPPQGSMLVVPQPLEGPPTSTTGNGAPPANGTPGRKYQCKMCPQVFVHKSAMQHHSREAHRGDLKPHQCQQCLKSFSSSHQLAQHVRIHTGERPYKCSYCDRRFKQLSHVQQHTRLHTGERPYKCHLPECGRAFIQLSNLQQHLRSHDGQMERAKSRPYHCNICGKGFALDSSLRTHRSGQHAALIGGAASQSCPICRRICVSAEALMEHMRTSHRDPSATGTPSILWGGEDGAGASHPTDDLGKRRATGHPCPVCGKAYVNEGSLRKHISSHPETASLASPLRMWPCTVCHSVFTQESGLLHHMEHMRMDPKHQFAAQYLLSRAAAERREKEAGPSADLLAAAQQQQTAHQHSIGTAQPASSLAALQATHLVH